MSHCLIVELSEDRISPLSGMRAYDLLEDEDIQYAADYVQDLIDTNLSYGDAVANFLNELGAAATYNKEDNSITFTHIEKFFEESFKTVKEMVATATINDFMNSHWEYKLRDHIRPIFGTYIHHTGDCSYPLPEFLRDYGKNGSKFYLGGICDYHC